MYKEEVENAGRPGWPDEPAVESEAEIAASILANNLHGIDIDLRSVQLSALTLFLRAKSMSPKASLTESHLACADIHMLDGPRLQEFLEGAGLQERPIYGRVLTALQQRLKDAEQLGSLIRLDAEIGSLVEKEREKYDREGRQPDLFGWPREQFETDAGRHEFWEMLEVQIGQALDAFAKARAAEGADQGFFAAETTKGLRLLEIMGERYDVVLTNPPYMSSRNMNAVLKRFLQKEYPVSKSDLYAAFIQRCTEWLGKHGRLGMITQQSFMFISSYEKLRGLIRSQVVLEAVPHVGPRAFEEVTGEKVNTTLLVFRQEADGQTRDDSFGTYFRLVKEPDAEAKRRRFEQAMAILRAGETDPAVYRYRQRDFDAIQGSPWVYWITSRLRRVFESFPKLGEFSPAVHGTATYDNYRFLRFWWEVGQARIGFANRSWEQFEESGDDFVPYMKGGPFRRWYGNQEYVIHVDDAAKALLTFIESKRDTLRGKDVVFRSGVTWSDLTSGRFSARLSPGGFIFDVKGSSAFPQDVPLVLGLLNSGFVQYALSLLNPTVSFQVGDLARVPVPTAASASLHNLVDHAIEIAKTDSEEDENTYDFVAPPKWLSGIDRVTERHAELAGIERQIDEEVYRLYGIGDEDRQAIAFELGELEMAENEDDEFSTENGNDETESTSEASLTREELAHEWISYAIGLVMGRFRPGEDGAIGRGAFPSETAARLQALADPDGVLVLDKGHPDDLAVKVVEALRLLLGDSDAAQVIAESTGRGGNSEEELRRYFGKSFFKEHVKRYRKRPVYWFLQSPRKNYGVWLFHEKLTKDTLYRVRGDEYVGSKVNLLESQIAELRKKRDAAEGRERRGLEQQIAERQEILDDIREFSARIAAVLERGYVPHIDDGVLINMAPLWELIPSWQAEPKKCWKALEGGDYDWSHRAMDHWPERVGKKCNKNKSYAIAHGLFE